MPALIVYSRYTPSTRALLRAASALGWKTARAQSTPPPEFALETDLAIFGTPPGVYELAQEAKRRLLSCPAGWEAALPEVYRRRWIRSSAFSELELPGDQPFFLKPALSKSFEPAVYTRSELAALEVPAEAQVLLAEPVHFECELRFFVAGRQTCASAFTRVHHEELTRRSAVPASAHREASEFVERLLADSVVDRPPGFVLDVGLIEGRGWAVVEANEAWAAGLYGCDPVDVLPVLLASCVPLDSPKRAWDQARAFLEARGEA